MADIVLRVTRFQAEEVEAGLAVDADDGDPEWGRIEWTGTRVALLHIADADAAIYRITSTRDIMRDHVSDGDASALSASRSMATLAEKLVTAAGGPESLRAETRQWL